MIRLGEKLQSRVEKQLNEAPEHQLINPDSGNNKEEPKAFSKEAWAAALSPAAQAQVRRHSRKPAQAYGIDRAELEQQITIGLAEWKGFDPETSGGVGCVTSHATGELLKQKALITLPKEHGQGNRSRKELTPDQAPAPPSKSFSHTPRDQEELLWEILDGALDSALPDHNFEIDDEEYRRTVLAFRAMPLDGQAAYVRNLATGMTIPQIAKDMLMRRAKTKCGAEAIIPPEDIIKEKRRLEAQIHRFNKARGFTENNKKRIAKRKGKKAPGC